MKRNRFAKSCLGVSRLIVNCKNIESVNLNLQLATMRLAYQDLSKQQKQREEQLKHLDPKKAQQVERLGMGIGIRG